MSSATGLGSAGAVSSVPVVEVSFEELARRDSNMACSRRAASA